MNKSQKVDPMRGWQLPKFEIKELSKKGAKFCICVPVKNEGQKIQKQLRKMKKYSPLADIIVADWGSKDGSLNTNFLKRQNVRTLIIKKSPGKQSSQLRIAFAYALKQGYRGIIQIDGNNKDGVGAIPIFVKALENGHDYVQGSRFIKGGKAKNTPLKRWFGIRFVTSPILSIASRYWYTDVTNGFRAYSRRYLLHPKVRPFRREFINYSLNFYLCVRANQLGLITKEVPVERTYPKGSVPTKMSGIGAELTLFFEVVKTALGFYHI